VVVPSPVDDPDSLDRPPGMSPIGGFPGDTREYAHSSAPEPMDRRKQKCPLWAGT
jgi:hypothetical protein